MLPETRPPPRPNVPPFHLGYQPWASSRTQWYLGSKIQLVCIALLLDTDSVGYGSALPLRADTIGRRQQDLHGVRFSVYCSTSSFSPIYCVWVPNRVTQSPIQRPPTWLRPQWTSRTLHSHTGEAPELSKQAQSQNLVAATTILIAATTSFFRSPSPHTSHNPPRS